MIKAFTEQGARVHYVLWDSFSINVGGECYTRYHGKCDAFDAVLVRGVGRSITPEKLLYRVTLLEAMEADGVVVLNPAKSLLVARNKMATMLPSKPLWPTGSREHRNRKPEHSSKDCRQL